VDDAVRAALDHGGLIEITTTGTRTGKLRRLEIVFHNFGRHLYISGMPNPARKRGWLANLEANPALTVHLKGAVQTDLPATARVITDPAERRSILEQIARVWRRTDLNEMLAHSPLIELTIEGYPG
jgi:deazaflavin-dependent oxidoreductase (nitroreductase family)